MTLFFLIIYSEAKKLMLLKKYRNVVLHFGVKNWKSKSREIRESYKAMKLEKYEKL